MFTDDPDQDLLDELDWQDRKHEIMHGLAAVASGALIFVAIFELTTLVFGWQFQASLDGAAVVAITSGILLFLKLDRAGTL